MSSTIVTWPSVYAQVLTHFSELVCNFLTNMTFRSFLVLFALISAVLSEADETLR